MKAYRTKYGKVPSYYSETNYTTAQMIHEVIKQEQRQVPGRRGIPQACSPPLKVDTPRGPVSHRRDAQPGAEHLHQESREEEDVRLPKEELWNTVIKTYPNVNQFGQFKKDEFLATPVYSRDYPPCKFCN